MTAPMKTEAPSAARLREAGLHRASQQGDRNALRQIVDENIGLVRARARRAARRSGRSLDDLIQEGTLGLLEAARRFDPKKHQYAAKFSSYATWWIDSLITEHVIRTHGPIRIGTRKSGRKLFFRLPNARRILTNGGHVETPDAVAALLELPVDEVRVTLPFLNPGFAVPITDDVRDNRDAHDDRSGVCRVCPMSLDPSPEEDAAAAESTVRAARILYDGLATLSLREQEIIRARCLSGEPTPLRILGQRFALSNERVRQIEQRALRKLRDACAAWIAP